jgi:hypothetical protein
VSVIIRGLKVLREEGDKAFIQKILSYACTRLKIIFGVLEYYYNRIFMSRKTFTFNGKTYYYFVHKYNTTWKNERAVEVPIIWDIVREHYRWEKRVLEVGNVLSHYFRVFHGVLDKYEVAEGVIKSGRGRL